MNELQQRQLELTRDHVERLRREHPLRELFWECTLRCNMACRHCGSDCLKESAVPDMPFVDFLPVLDEVAAHCDPSQVMVDTVGGEPLVRSDLMDCGRAIRERGFMWGFVTNGLLLDHTVARELAQAGINSLALDVDGMREEHNWLRNSTKSFDAAMRAIEAVQTIPDLTWDVITCVNGRNLHRLNEVKKLLIEAGVTRWRCFTIDPMGRAANDRSLLLSDEEFRELLNFIVTTRIEGKINLSYACDGFMGAYEGLIRDHFFNCQAGLTVASVRANGDISGCLSIRSDYSQGNIYRDSFWDVWENRFEPFRNREWMRRGPCQDCEMFRYCQGDGLHLRDGSGDLMMTCHYNQLKNVRL
ncbi:MAG: TIGR04133 family radical SAM/SPASM protein [Muribaculaceae bacterium]|nr:TIGR04133 family radical SAM/SPASM protein [Muribaculaceae bacterium]